jgi:hypothetical protein
MILRTTIRSKREQHYVIKYFLDNILSLVKESKQKNSFCSKAETFCCQINKVVNKIMILLYFA